jgi:integrase
MRGYIDSQCKSDTSTHWRSVHVALLLAADSGLRREELAGARRERMSPTTYGDGDDVVWQLSITGKGNKERTVPVSPTTIEALAAHWRDRGEDFERRTAGPLLAPIFIPQLSKPNGSTPMGSRWRIT